MRLRPSSRIEAPTADMSVATEQFHRGAVLANIMKEDLCWAGPRFGKSSAM